MQIALIQQTASPDPAANLSRALAAIKSAAAARGAELVAFAELAFEPFYPRERACGTVANLAEPIPGPSTNGLGELDGKETTASTTVLIDNKDVIRWVFRPDDFITRLSAVDLLAKVDEYLKNKLIHVSSSI